jgi:hypothetical protein
VNRSIKGLASLKEERHAERKAQVKPTRLTNVAPEPPRRVLLKADVRRRPGEHGR